VEWANRCAMAAPAVHEKLEIARVRVEAEAFRADQARQRAEKRKAAEIEDFRDHLLRTGQRWHTVAEALALERGIPLG